MLHIEDGFHEANNHKLSISYLHKVFDITLIEFELVSPWGVGVCASNNVVAIDSNQSLVCNLRLGILQNIIIVHIPGIINVVIVEDAFLVPHYHIFVHIEKIHDAKIFCWHGGCWEHVSFGESIGFDDSDETGGPGMADTSATLTALSSNG